MTWVPRFPPLRRKAHRNVPASVGSDCGGRLRLHSTVDWSVTARRQQGRSDAVPAVDEGNSSKGVKRVAGRNPPGQATVPRDGGGSEGTQKRGEPWSGSGMQQARKPTSGANRHGGAKPRRRNMHQRLAAHGAEGSSLPGVDARWGCRRKGERESHERAASPRGVTGARGSASKWRPRP